MISPDIANDQDADILPSEVFVERSMPAILKTPDLVAIFIVAVFYITNAAIAASGGATAYIYWIAGALTFFLPCGIAAAQLGTLFPGEGSLYNWTHRVLGPYWAFFAGACWWFPVPLLLVSTADTLVTYIQGLNSGWLVEPWQQGLTVIGIVVLSGVVACQRARMVQVLVNFGALLILPATILIAASAALWLLHGHGSMTSFSHASDWSVSSQNFGLFSLVTLAYLGTHVPLNMGGEIVNNRTQQGRKAISTHILWGSLLVFVGYLVVTFALHVVQGPTNGATPFALIATVNLVLGKVAGNVVVVCIMTAFLITTIMYNASFARLLLVGAIDQRLPITVGRLNVHRVPANAIIFQTSIAVLIAIIGFLAIPYAFFKLSAPATLSIEFYTIGQALVAIVWALITLFFYIDLVMLVINKPQLLRQKRIFPWWVIWLAIGLGPLGCLATIAGALRYSWIPQQIPDGIWFGILIVLLVITTTIVGIGSMYATSVVAWQRLRGDEMPDTQ